MRQAVLERKKQESVEENKKAEAELRRKALHLRAPRDWKLASELLIAINTISNF